MNEPALANRVMAIVVGVLRSRLPVRQLPDHVTFHDLCINGFERVYMADAIERQWTVEFPDDEIDGWDSVDDIVTSLAKRLV
jgi:acyl carrier protein